MLTKEKIIESIERMPDNIEIDDLLERILLLEKIEKGIEQSENGLTIPDEDMEKRIESWLV